MLPLGFGKENMCGNNIYKADHFTVTHHVPLDAKDELVVVCFDTIFGDNRESGFGTDFLKKEKIESVFVSPRKNSFYQYLSGKSLALILAEVLEKKRVVTYGSSLGGYAAIYYSGFLNATAVALSPICSILPEVRERYPNKLPVYYTHLALDSVPKSSEKIRVVYDPLESKDEFFVNNILKKNYPDSYFVEIEDGQHSVADSLVRSGSLKNFFYQCVSVDACPEIFCDPALDYRYWLKYLRLRFKEGDLDKAATCLNGFLEAGGDFSQVAIFYSKLVLEDYYDALVRPVGVKVCLVITALENAGLFFHGCESGVQSLAEVGKLHFYLTNYDAALATFEILRQMEKFDDETLQIYNTIKKIV